MEHRQRPQGGFTLTELLTTVSVIGISLAMVVPGFDSVMTNNRRATTINQLVTTLHAARSEAITRNQQVTVCPSADGAACTDGGAWNDGWIYFADEDRSRTVNGTDVVLGQYPGDGRLAITSAEFGAFFAYRPNGRVMVNTADENQGQFVFCDHRGADEARVLIINSTGEPRVAETLADGEAPDCGEG